MTELLLKLFINNYRDPQSPAVRSSIGTLAGVVGILCNILLFLGKLAAGLLSGSVSILADAVNNMTDAASSVLTYFGFRMARQPADKDHPYGHARYEYLTALGVAVLIMVLGIELAQSSFDKILNPETTVISGLTYGILLASMGVKLWMYLFFRGLGKRIASPALTATAADSRNDILASGAVLAGCLLEQFLDLQADGFIGLAVAAFIVWSGFGLAKQTISPLIGQQADRELLDQITRLIMSHDKILGVHDLLVHDYGPGQCFASAHVEISADEHPMDSHEIIDHIERDALADLNVHLVIHYDPVPLRDARQHEMQHLVSGILSEIDPALSIHDFRLLRRDGRETLTFDLEVPYDSKESRDALKRRIDEKLWETYPDCATDISFDGKA